MKTESYEIKNTEIFISDKLNWSERMVLSEIYRRNYSLAFQKSVKGRWDYTTGLLLSGILKVWDKTKDKRYFEYVKVIMDSFIDDYGNIRGYTIEEYNIDNINSGKVLFPLYKYTKEEKYKKAIYLLMEQLNTQPRTKKKGFWHKKIYPNQMWLDGIYMGSPFYAEFCKTFNYSEGFDDVANQIILIEKHTRDKKTGLLYHGWDESKLQEWADPVTGCSKNFWGRAIGWYLMGIVDVLDFLPKDHSKRDKIISIFIKTIDAIIKYMDNNGLWYQVIDQGDRKGNYLESSASCMFTYALAKGILKNYLGSNYKKIAMKAFNGILKKFIDNEANGILNLNNICQVAGLGGEKRRDGTFEYYISEPVIKNDRKGVGSFIMASYEIEKLDKK